MDNIMVAAQICSVTSHYGSGPQSNGWLQKSPSREANQANANTLRAIFPTQLHSLVVISEGVRSGLTSKHIVLYLEINFFYMV